MPSESAIPLAKAIQDLRGELLAALREGANEELRFRLKPIELELQLAVTKEGGGEGSVKFWVLEFGAKAGLEHAATHKLKLILEPRWRNNEEFQVGDVPGERPD